jgi:parallel beta-helix repeat protein
MNSTETVRTIVLLLVLDVLALMFGNFILTANGTQTSIFTDDFESYAVGAFPYAWELWYDGMGVGQQKIADTVSASPTKLLQLYGRLGWAASIQPVRTSPMTITVPDDYPTIQQAINNANEGDIAYVKAGTYYENVVVNKTVLLIGENKEDTIIDGNNTDWEVIKIMANNTIVSGFTVKNSSWFGIQIWNSFGSTIRDNNVIDTFYGIRLDQSTSNSIIGNTVKSNRFMGILLGSSSNNILRYNEMANNPQNFGVWGISISDFINDVDTSNTVNGKPVYYWINQHNRQIPADAGVVMVVNSSKIIVKNLTLRNNDHGVYFAYTSSSFIERNVVTNNTYGIDLFQSFNNTISGNVALQNSEGISMRFASNNNIVRNNSVIASSGVYLYQSNANRIIGNTIRNSQDYGIDFHESNSNSFYHNNLISNKRNVSPYATGTNVWDDGYPSGGNYWSDYEKRYPTAKELDDSGIWDTPYVIDTSNQDNYPLIKLWTPAPPAIVAAIGIDPDTLNLKSKGKWITAYIELPEGYDVKDIDIQSIKLNDAVSAKSKPRALGDYDNNAIPDLMVKFDRTKVISYVLTNMDRTHLTDKLSITATLTITGKLNDGTLFQGNDTIRVIYPIRGSYSGDKSKKSSFSSLLELMIPLFLHG